MDLKGCKTVTHKGDHNWTQTESVVRVSGLNMTDYINPHATDMDQLGMGEWDLQLWWA